MTINVFGGGDSSGPAFPVQRSVRLRSSASAYFNRTVASTTNTWTFSAWVKRGALGTSQTIAATRSASAGGSAGIYFNSNDTINITLNTVGVLTTTAVYRDPSAWYHIQVSVTQSGASYLYVNGIQIGTWTSGATSFLFNSAATWVNAIGRNGDSNTLYYDGYLTEVNFIDGQALTPASFGSYNSNGVWQNIKYSGTYGTNGFYLNFQDNSAATAAAIGKDSSGNGNNWTPNNISVTAGVTYDSMLDVPTLTSADNANFCVLNPVTPYLVNTTLSQGNLVATKAAATSAPKIYGTFGVNSGKWYWEIKLSAQGGVGNYYAIIGVSNASSPSGTDSAAVFYFGTNDATIAGDKGVNGVNSNYGANYIAGDTIGVALDCDNLQITFYKNGASQGLITGLTADTYFPRMGTDGTSNSATFEANFGQRPFTYTPPTGFKSLNTYNLPDSTIPNGATQFAATTYTGTGASLAISNTVNGKSFQPDFVWVKGRSGATDHALYDSVRGTTKQLESNTTTEETTEATGLTAFGSSGFTVGALAQMNTNTATYVGWQWKAGGTAVTNTSGSISSQVSANPSAGFSIVTYTGTGANATVGHGLGIAPKMFFIFNRTTGFAYSHPFWHTSFGGSTNTDYMYLDSTIAKGGSGAASFWNATAPTSTTISIGTDITVNRSTNTYVAYCFSEIAGFSKFGSYTGNGSTDGPFVYLGFRPRWVLLKSTTIDAWLIIDSSRQTYNVMGPYLIPNSSAAEGTVSFIDFTSNGFKIRNTGSGYNTSSQTYIYAAFAENPFKNSLAR